MVDNDAEFIFDGRDVYARNGPTFKLTSLTTAILKVRSLIEDESAPPCFSEAEIAPYCRQALKLLNTAAVQYRNYVRTSNTERLQDMEISLAMTAAVCIRMIQFLHETEYGQRTD